MSFIETVPTDEATGQTAALYAEHLADKGYLPNYVRLFSFRPAAYVGWRQLVGAIRAGMDPRRYELATLAAARALKSTYCAAEHALVLREGFYDAERLREIVSAHASAGLAAVDVAIMDFADKVARDAPSVGPDDVDRLRRVGLTDADADDVARKIGVPEGSIGAARANLQGLYKAYWETDASLAEINPLILTGDGKVVALDAKFNFDSNALFRHPEIVAYRDLDEEDPAEVEASKFDLAYISLDGNIGCLVNGAGLAMATMDTIKLFGGEPANFLDVGGGATAEKVTEAFKIMLKNPGLKAILVNIFGGIMRCDVIAEGVITASKAVSLQVPLVVRMKGTNEDLGKKMLADSGLPIISADTMEDAAKQVVAAAAGQA